MATFPVFVKATATYVIEVSSDTTIGELKQKIYEKSQILPENQSLQFSGKFLKEDNQTLAFYNIQNSNTIHLAAAVVGGK